MLQSEIKFSQSLTIHPISMNQLRLFSDLCILRTPCLIVLVLAEENSSFCLEIALIIITNISLSKTNCITESTLEGKCVSPAKEG